MLYYIIGQNDNGFQQYMDYAQNVYWPSEVFTTQDIIKILPNWKDPFPDEKDRINQLDSAQVTISQKTGLGGIYPITTSDGRIKKCMPFPFIDRFHRFFMKRKWMQIQKNPGTNAKEHFQLQEDEKRGGNYSANSGNYNHFVKVVAALARLIMHFNAENRVKELLEYPHTQDDAFLSHARLAFCETVPYSEAPNLRTFKLMLAGFYHDLGKTVTDPRHGIEGGIIMAFDTISPRTMLNKIAREYDAYNYDRDDFLFLIEMLNYHDQFGTLNTGEDGYLRLVDMIDRIKRYSLKHDEPRSNQIDWSQKYLFDLWLLNVADIIVSLDNKYEEDLTIWMSNARAEAAINNFFKTPVAYHLKHDLMISGKLLHSFNSTRHSDNISEIQAEAYTYSRRHAMERVRRLIMSSLLKPLKNQKYELKPLKNQKYRLCKKISTLSSDRNQSSIDRAIQSTGDVQEFCGRLAWIGKMDYSLTFFEEIAESAIERVIKELYEEGPLTGWVPRKENMRAAELGDDKMLIQAQFFLSNYTATMIQILSYLLFRERKIDRLRNIEFCDMRERLTDEKRDRILSLDGPFRSRRATQLVLQNIYLY